MPALSYKGANCTGDGCFPPRPSIEGSPNVYVNGKPVLRVGDKYAPHTCGDSKHDGACSSGSSSVFCNGKPVARVGDDVSCGAAVAMGSPNVFVGG